MLKNEYVLSVDLKLKQTAVVPTFVQNDSATLIFKVYDKGKPFDMSGVTQITVTHKKKDGTVTVGVATTEQRDGMTVVRYDYLGSEMDKEGFAETALTIFSGEQRVSIQPFKVHFIGDITNAIGAKEEFGLLQDMIVTVDEATLNANDKATHAQKQGDYAKVQGDAAKAEAANMATIKTDTINATKSAQTATKNANDAATNATTQADYAKTEADRAKAEADRLVGTDVSKLDNKIGVLPNLKTAEKTNIVGAVNEVNQQLADTSQETIRNTQSRYRNGNNNTIVTFIDDDGTKEFIERLKPIFDSEGVKCTIPVNTGALGLVTASATRLTLPELLQLQNEGYEIVSHGHDHINMSTDQTDAALEKELGNSQKFLKDNGFKGYKYFVYPNGVRATDYRTQGFVRKYYECGINSAGAIRNNIPVDQFNLTRVGLNETLDKMKSWIDNAQNEWIIFISHAWQEAFADPTQQENIRQLIQYIKSKKIDIVSVEEGLNRFGNVIDYQFSSDNYLKISKTGKIKSPDITQTGLYYLSPGGDSDVNQPMSYYKQNAITLRHFANNLPSTPTPNKGGVLKTYRAPTSDAYSYQEWTNLSTGEIFLRYWNTGSLVWQSWIAKDTAPLVFINGPINDTDINKAGSTFQQGITVRAHPTNQTTNAPEPNVMGISTTVRAHSSEVYIYQEWASLTGKKFIRWWQNSAWTAWTQI